jgi:hypothetical protein
MGKSLFLTCWPTIANRNFPFDDFPFITCTVLKIAVSLLYNFTRINVCVVNKYRVYKLVSAFLCYSYASTYIYILVPYIRSIYIYIYIYIWNVLERLSVQRLGRRFSHHRSVHSIFNCRYTSSTSFSAEQKNFIFYFWKLRSVAAVRSKH